MISACGLGWLGSNVRQGAGEQPKLCCPTLGQLWVLCRGQGCDSPCYKSINRKKDFEEKKKKKRCDFIYENIAGKASITPNTVLEWKHSFSCPFSMRPLCFLLRWYWPQPATNHIYRQSHNAAWPYTIHLIHQVWLFFLCSNVDLTTAFPFFVKMMFKMTKPVPKTFI